MRFVERPGADPENMENAYTFGGSKEDGSIVTKGIHNEKMVIMEIFEDLIN
jgi:hypothetical protein